MKVTKNVSGQASRIGVSLLRILGSKLTMLLFAGWLALGSASAQNINDWVGNQNLVSGNVAIERLKQSARTIIQNVKQQTPSQTSTSVSNGQGLDFHFVLRVAEEIASNNRSSKDAINLIAADYATTGMTTSEVSRVVAFVVAILS